MYLKHKGAYVYFQKIPEHLLQIPFYFVAPAGYHHPLPAMFQSCSFLAPNLPLLNSLSLPIDSSFCLPTPSSTSVRKHL